MANKQSFSTALIAGVATVLLLMGITAYVLYVFMQRTNADAAARMINDMATAQASSMQSQIDLITGEANEIAKKFELIEAISATDNDAESRLMALGEQIKGNNHFVDQASIIPRGKTENYPLTFAELDQVKKVEKGEESLPEAIFANNEWHFIISVPVYNTKHDTQLGTLFMSYKMDRILPVIKAFDHSNHSTSLVQMFDNVEPRIIFTEGKFAPQLKKTDLLQIGKTHWYILFTPGPDFRKKEGLNPAYLAAALGLLGVVLSLVVIFVLRKSRIVPGAVAQGDRPIQIASAKTITKGGKVDIDQVSALATGQSSSSSEDFNEISDPLFQHSEILDVEVAEEEPAMASTASSEPTVVKQAVAVAPSSSGGGINPAIFRDYDIRGDAGIHLTDEVVFAIGQAIGSEAQSRGQLRIAVAADGRTSSPRIKEKLIKGITATGTHVVDIGSAPSPILYFVTETTEIHSGVMVTASHNPASDNGFKIVLKGKTLSDDGIQSLKNRIDTGNFTKGSGNVSQQEYTSAYLEKITSDIALSSQLKVVLDCGNGIAGEIAPKLFTDLGCDVVPLFCDVDGNFPNHEPDPSVEANLKSLVSMVNSENADLGIAFDGDGDRLVAVSSTGKIVLPDRLLMLFAKDIVSRNPGTDIIFDVKCTRRLNSLISGYGGRPLMWKSGHAHIKNKMQETGALLGGELSGHIFFKERWYGFDDGLYAAARLLEILSIRDQSLDAALSTLPVSAITPEIRIPVDEDKKFELVEKLIAKGEFSGGKITTLDGLRVDFAKGWGLVRASNTSACLTLRFEADNDEMLLKIKDLFREQMKAHLPGIHTNF